jgi:hypothetical protein
LAAAGCSKPPASRAVQVGRHHLRLTIPPGWEHLDHGRQHLFRVGETELLLEDFGPATREGLVRELHEAEELMRAGRREDAMARVRRLHGPPLAFLYWKERAEFWSPWTDVTYIRGAADDATLAGALRELIRRAEALPDVPIDRVVEHVLARAPQAERWEVARREPREIHGRRWVWIETWDRVSHLYRHRLACLEDDGYLLLLTTRRGLIGQSGGGFDSLLASIEVLPPS